MGLGAAFYLKTPAGGGRCKPGTTRRERGVRSSYREVSGSVLPRKGFRVHRSPALVLGMGLLLAAGCARQATRPEDIFKGAYAAFEANQWQQAVDGFTRYLQAGPTTPMRGEVYYYRGQALVHLNRREEARADFERAIGARASPPIPGFARVAIGNLYYEEGNDRKAIQTYLEILRKPDATLPLDMIILRLAVSLQRIGQWSAADQYLAYLINRYSDTQSAVEAWRRFHATGFTVQTGAFASNTAALRQADRLRGEGFLPTMGQAKRGSQTFYAVRVGKVQTYAEAAALAQQIRQAGFPVLIVP